MVEREKKNEQFFISFHQEDTCVVTARAFQWICLSEVQNNKSEEENNKFYYKLNFFQWLFFLLLLFSFSADEVQTAKFALGIFSSFSVFCTPWNVHGAR